MVDGWLANKREKVILGMNANTPKVDHPDINKNKWWWDDEPILKEPPLLFFKIRD